MKYSRFAIYYVPPDGALAMFGAAWLGWNISLGETSPHLDVPGLADITETPRKYGFHGTLKPPFRLAGGASAQDLGTAIAHVAARTAPAHCGGLELAALGRFLALVPLGDTNALARLAETCVTQLDRFRAPPTEAELEKRNKTHLNARQKDLLLQWGYPYVQEQFRFHMTVTARMPKADVPHWMQIAKTHLPDLRTPFEIAEITLCGERADGHFEVITRYPLTG